MNYYFAFLACALWGTPYAQALTLNDTPICIVPTPNSILLNPTNYKPVAVGARMRYATCTGAAWFHGNYLAILNLYGKKLITYRFDEEKQKFSPLQEIDHRGPVQFSYPESLAVSPDGTLLALCDNHPGTSGIYIYDLNPETHLINPSPLFSLPVSAFVHNVRFTPDGKHLAYATFDNTRAVMIYAIGKKPNALELNHVSTHKNEQALVKAKGIHFTHNGKYAVIAYALSISTSVHNPLQSLVAIHEFDSKTGVIGNLVCSVPGPFSFEDLTFLDNDHIIALPDQAGDQIILYRFDPTTGQIHPDYTLIKNPEAQLSFPHGVAASPDGNYLVATNYGTDTFNLYCIN